MNQECGHFFSIFNNVQSTLNIAYFSLMYTMIKTGFFQLKNFYGMLYEKPGLSNFYFFSNVYAN